MFGPVSEGMRLFKNGGRIAVVGYSENPHRAALKVSKYLIEEGNSLVGVNPTMAKAEVLDVPMVGALSDLEKPVEIIQVFRNSSHLPALSEEIKALNWKPKLVWCQQGVIDIPFQNQMEAHGVQVVMDACPYALRSFL